MFVPVDNLLKTIFDEYPEHEWIQTEEAAKELMTIVANMAAETEEDINNPSEVDKLLYLRVMESACNLISCINEYIDKVNNEDQ